MTDPHADIDAALPDDPLPDPAIYNPAVAAGRVDPDAVYRMLLDEADDP